MNRKAPFTKASEYKMHTIKKGLDKNIYIVSKKSNGVKYWKKTTIYEKKCRNNLQNNINYMLNEYKKGNLSSNKQAIAIAYSKLYKSHPNCKKYLYNKSKKNNK